MRTSHYGNSSSTYRKEESRSVVDTHRGRIESRRKKAEIEGGDLECRRVETMKIFTVLNENEG
jgi:hypothetical protein